MPEVRLSVCWKGKTAPSTLGIEVDEEITCGELTAQLVDELWLGDGRRRGAWHLVERWMGCERQLPDEERFLGAVKRWEVVGGGGKGMVCLKCEPCVKSREVKRRGRRKAHYLRGDMTKKKLTRLRRDLKATAISLSTQASTLWLQKLAQGGPLEAGSNPLEPLIQRLAELREGNLQLSTEISELNMRAGGLPGELQALRERGRGLSEDVRSVEEEVEVMRGEKEREARSKVADLQTDAIRLKRELETRNRLNGAQSSKLQSQKETLIQKRQQLALRQQELARAKSEITRARRPMNTHPAGSHDSHMTQPAESHDVDRAEQSEEATPPALRLVIPGATGFTEMTSLPGTPQSSRLSHTPSSTLKKKAVFEARTRQLNEAEAEEFRRQRRGEGEEGRGKGTAKRLDFSSSVTPHEELQQAADTEPSCLLPSELMREAERLLTVPQPDQQWYQGGGSPDISYRDKIDRVLGGREGRAEVEGERKNAAEAGEGEEEEGSMGGAAGDFFSDVMATFERRQSVGGATSTGSDKAVTPGVKRVRFAPDAVIMPAALEGELDIVRNCVEELGSCDQRSHKGATCLHNAVCSGHLPTMQYLVEAGCNINSQDEDGWTPLHCAVAYSNAAAVSYLLSAGASLWLQTRDEGDTPLALGNKELAAQRVMGGPESLEAAQKSLLCLEDAHRELGVAKGGVVYALFSRRATDWAELSLREGERLVVLRRNVGVRGGGGDGWWEVESEGGERGQVPHTYLGIAPRHKVTL